VSSRRKRKGGRRRIGPPPPKEASEEQSEGGSWALALILSGVIWVPTVLVSWIDPITPLLVAGLVVSLALALVCFGLVRTTKQPIGTQLKLVGLPLFIVAVYGSVLLFR
jgi:hypothetical protein